MAAIKVIRPFEYRNKLEKLYKKILHLSDKIPKESMYKVNMEIIVSHRLCILKESQNTKDLESRINCGSLKMLVQQAEAEYELCQKMILWKPWEALIHPPPPFQWKWPV